MSPPPPDHSHVLADIVRACKKELPELPHAMIISAAISAGEEKHAANSRDWPQNLICRHRAARTPADRVPLDEELRAQGFENIQLPRCATCGRARIFPTRTARAETVRKVQPTRDNP